MESTDSYWIICDDQNEVCHCDWRVNVRGCFERNAMYIIYLINVVWSALVLLIASKLCYTRMVVNKQRIFEQSSSSKFFMRPRPIEGLLFFGVVFNLLRIFSSLIMALDVIPNQIFRSFIYEFPWQAGITAFACYLFGIAHTVSNSSKVIRNNWFKSGLKIDIMCTTLICLPFITNNICSIGAGVYASRGDFVTADKFTRGLYSCWVIYCFGLGTMILVAGMRLLNILSQHLKNQTDNTRGTQKIRHGMFKVKVIMGISVICLYVFAFIKLMYAIMRPRLLENTGLNLALAVIWTYDGTAASLLVVLTLLINPKALNPLNMSSDQGSSNMLNRSNFAGSTTIVSSEFDQIKTDNYNHFESISEDEEEKIQMDNHHHGYYVTETGKPVLTSTYETTDNCLVDQQNYYNVTAANGRSRTSPTLYKGFNSNATTTTTTTNTLHHETSYYDKKDDGYGSGLGELHQSGISEAHLVTHAD